LVPMQEKMMFLTLNIRWVTAMHHKYYKHKDFGLDFYLPIKSHIWIHDLESWIVSWLFSQSCVSQRMRITDPRIRKRKKNYQRGTTDPPNGGVFQVFPEYASPRLLHSNLAPNGSSREVEFHCSKCGPLCLIIGRGVNPTFHHKISIAGHPHYQITWFLVL
jgi:hypothetical protein